MYLCAVEFYCNVNERQLRLYSPDGGASQANGRAPNTRRHRLEVGGSTSDRETVKKIKHKIQEYSQIEIIYRTTLVNTYVPICHIRQEFIILTRTI